MPNHGAGVLRGVMDLVSVQTVRSRFKVPKVLGEGLKDLSPIGVRMQPGVSDLSRTFRDLSDFGARLSDLNEDLKKIPKTRVSDLKLKTLN